LKSSFLPASCCSFSSFAVLMAVVFTGTKISQSDKTRAPQNRSISFSHWLLALLPPWSSRWSYSVTRLYQKYLDFRLDSCSSWLDGVNGILMQQEPNSPKQDFWNQRAIASLANTLFTVVEPVPTPLLSSMLLLQL
jgi:hypothetical protein